MNWHSLRPNLCWQSNNVFDIIPVEAESPTDAVFNATHSRLPMIQREQVDSDLGSAVYEDELLRAVESQPVDYPILPILGHSGTGKSHLVRLLRMRLEDQKESHPERILIFVPKHKMSLRAILDLILDHAQSEEAEGFRQRIHDANEQLTNEKDARNRLRATLSYLIEAQINGLSDVASEESSERLYIAGELPNLLDDAFFKKRLLADDGAIARLVKEKLAGKSQEDKDEPFAFSSSDLHLTVDDTNRASADAREFAEVLGGDAVLRGLAATMLNEQLAPAVSSVFGVGGDDLKDLLIDLRLDLGKRGQEILLLIEDFSIFQGVQGGLIDAMTQIPTQGNPLCPMKVVMAVTTGYFRDQIPDTAKTRTYRVFDMDVPLTSTNTVSLDFVARYLNAVRVGPARIEAAYTQKEPIPNECDSCPVSNTCHSAFGSKDGIGLFPFNEFSLGRAILSQQHGTRGFIARDVLNRVLRPVLHEDRDAIVNSRFPGRAFEQRFASGITAGGEWNVETTASIRRPGDSDDMVNQRRRLLTFWAETPGAQNLAPGTHDAFSVPEVPDLPRSPERTTPVRHTAPGQTAQQDTSDTDASEISTDRRTSTPVAPTVREAPVPPLVEAIDSWSLGQQFQMNPQNLLRRLVFTAVVQKINFEDGFRSDASWTISGTGTPGDRDLSGSSLFGQTSIFLQGTRQKVVSETRIDISRDDIDAVRTLRALAFLEASGSWLAIENGAELQRVTTRQVARWASDIEEQLKIDRQLTEEIDPEIGYIADALILSSQMLGTKKSFQGSNSGKKIESLFASVSPTDPELIPPALRALRAFAVAENGTSSREVLQKIILRRSSYTQGGGKIAGVDTRRILRSHNAFARDDEYPDSIPQKIVEYVSRLRTLISDLSAVRHDVEASLPDLSSVDSNFREMLKQVSTTLQILQTTGLLPNRVDMDSIIKQGKSIDLGDVQRVTAVRESLNNWDRLSTEEKLESMAGEWPISVSRLVPWITELLTALDAIDTHLTNKIDPELQAESVRVDSDLEVALHKAIAPFKSVLEAN